MPTWAEFVTETMIKTGVCSPSSIIDRYCKVGPDYTVLVISFQFALCLHVSSHLFGLRSLLSTIV